MSKGKFIPFPAERFFDEEKYINNLELEGEKDYIVCEYAMRVVQAIKKEVENETNNVISTTNKAGDKTFYLSVDEILHIIQVQLNVPVQ